MSCEKGDGLIFFQFLALSAILFSRAELVEGPLRNICVKLF